LRIARLLISAHAENAAYSSARPIGRSAKASAESPSGLGHNTSERSTENCTDVLATSHAVVVFGVAVTLVVEEAEGRAESSPAPLQAKRVREVDGVVVIKLVKIGTVFE
jgi:hypothetical protein